MSVLLKLSKSSKKRFENNSVVITQKNQYKRTGFFIAFSQKSTAYAVSEKKFTSWLLRGVKWLNG